MKYTISIALLLTVLALTACGSDASKTDDTDTLTQSTASVETETERVAAPTHLPEVDYTGETFTILYLGEGHPYTCNDLLSTGTDGEVVNDTVFERNLKLEEKYGITLVGIERADAAVTAKQEILGGNQSFDILCEQMSTLYNLFIEDYLLDWNSLSYFDPSLPWWDINAAEELSVAGKLYMTPSDVTMTSSQNARFLYINKKLAAQYELQIPYDLVREGKWTWDKMVEMISTVSADLDGDGKMTGMDRYGMFTEHDEFFLVGMGMKFIEKDKDDYPVLALMNERNVDAVDRIKELFSNKVNTITFWEASENADISGFAHLYDYCRSLFASDHTLFVQNGAGVAFQFANMEAEYGILPNPKFDESQEKYYHLVDRCACAWSIPTTCANTEMLDVIMNYWGYLSSNSLVEAFYDTTMQYKRLNSKDDYAMLDIVRASLRFDLGYIYDFGITGILDDVVNSKNQNLSSMYEKRRKSLESKLSKMVDALEN